MDRGVGAPQRGTRQFMTIGNLVPPAEQTLPVLYTLSVSIFGALAESERPDPYLDGKLIVHALNGDVAIEHADPHIVIADSLLKQIDNGNAGSYVSLRPPRQSAPAGLRTGASPRRADTWAGRALRVHGINRDLSTASLGNTAYARSPGKPLGQISARS